MASVNSWFHLPKILFSALQLKLFYIAQRCAHEDAKHKKLLNLLCIVYIESRSYTTGYENRSSSDLKCGTRHRGYPGTGITEGDCTNNPEDWNNKSIK